jgi:hypothetical protein
MDPYQAIYDGVRSRLSNCDVGTAIENAVREANIGHYAERAFEHVREVCAQLERPSAVFRPTLTRDGDAWIALYGPDLQVGVAGCGATPEAAMRDFDAAWLRNK